MATWPPDPSFYCSPRMAMCENCPQRCSAYMSSVLENQVRLA